MNLWRIDMFKMRDKLTIMKAKNLNQELLVKIIGGTKRNYKNACLVWFVFFFFLKYPSAHNLQKSQFIP